MINNAQIIPFKRRATDRDHPLDFSDVINSIDTKELELDCRIDTLTRKIIKHQMKQEGQFKKTLKQFFLLGFLS